jgi:ADP-dependent phosphofructokinase/glucokinase
VDVYGCNEDELQAHLDRSVDLLDPNDVAMAIEEFAATVQVPALVVHTTHWALAYGPEAGRYEPALAGGTTMAATRYRCGDGFALRDYRETATLPVQPAGATLAGGLRDLLGSSVVCVPAYDVVTDDPTTIGLGDTFVGGFVAALAAPALLVSTQGT